MSYAPEYLKECFDYDPVAGILVGKARPLSHFLHRPNPMQAWKESNRRSYGRIVGYNPKGRYTVVRMGKGKPYMAHRIAWILHHGPIPEGHYLDHINGNKHDFRLCNLRLVTPSQNLMNSITRSDNALGVKGVCKVRNKFRMSIKGSGRTIVKDYDTLKAAKRARRYYEKKLHGEYSFSARP